jgi:type I restriction enzyme S subunit
MQRLLTRGIGHNKFKKTELGEIPEEWEIKSITELSKVVTIGVVNSATPYYTSKEKGISYFRTQNVRKNNLTDLNLVYVTKEFNQKHKKSILQENDILTVQTGEIGTSCLVPKKFEGCNCHSIIITRTDSNKLNPQFVCQLLNSGVGKGLISKFTLDTGRGHLLLEDYRNLRIATPLIEEQKEIASILSDADDWVSQEMNEKSQLENLKKGLMKQLLTGKIRIRV